MCTCAFVHTAGWCRRLSRPFPICFFGGLVLFAGFAAGLLAGVSTQFIQCGEYRSAVKVSTCNTPPSYSPAGGISFEACQTGQGDTRTFLPILLDHRADFPLCAASVCILLPHCSCTLVLPCANLVVLYPYQWCRAH